MNYVVHHMNLEFLFKTWPSIEKVHRTLPFSESPYLKEYINHNTKLPLKGTNDFEKDFFNSLIMLVLGNSGKC